MTGILVGIVMVGTFAYAVYRVLKELKQPKTSVQQRFTITIKRKD